MHALLGEVVPLKMPGVSPGIIKRQQGCRNPKPVWYKNSAEDQSQQKQTLWSLEGGSFQTRLASLPGTLAHVLGPKSPSGQTSS
jgi:hypothetical protein